MFLSDVILILSKKILFLPFAMGLKEWKEFGIFSILIRLSFSFPVQPPSVISCLPSSFLFPAHFAFSPKLRSVLLHPTAHFSQWTLFLNAQCLFLILFSRVHATLQPALSVGRSVGRLVGWSVGRSVTLYFFLWFYFFDITAPAQMVWWPQIWPLPTRTRLR